MSALGRQLSGSAAVLWEASCYSGFFIRADNSRVGLQRYRALESRLTVHSCNSVFCSESPVVTTQVHRWEFALAIIQCFVFLEAIHTTTAIAGVLSVKLYLAVDRAGSFRSRWRAGIQSGALKCPRALREQGQLQVYEGNVCNRRSD